MMNLKAKLVNVSRWDTYAIIIIVLAIMIQVFHLGIMPINIDVYYHLLVTKAFNESGGWGPVSFWEYAPIGRPQLYPPLLHIIMLLLFKAGIPILLVGKIVQFSIYPLLLFVIWYAIREIFDKQPAFFSTFMVFSIYSFYLVSLNTLAASLALIFGFLSLVCLVKNKILTAVLFLTLTFYTHSFTSWVFLGALILYGILDIKKVLPCLQIAFMALFMASPIIIYQFMLRNFYYFLPKLGENYFIELNIFHLFILPFSLIFCLKRKGRYYILLSLFVVFLFLNLAGFIFRYLSFYGVMSIVFMNAIFLSHIYGRLKKRGAKFYLGSILLLIIIFSPELFIDLSGRKPSFRLSLANSTLSNFVSLEKDMRVNEKTIYSERLFKQVSDVIASKSNKGDIIYVNFPYTSGILSLLSSRNTSSAMLSEVAPYVPFDQISAAKLVVWQKDPDDMVAEPLNLIKRYRLKKIADTEMAFVYENTFTKFKQYPRPALISYKILFSILFFVFGCIVLLCRL